MSDFSLVTAPLIEYNDYRYDQFGCAIWHDKAANTILIQEINKMINNLTIGDISIDCKEPEKLCDFYANLSGWEKRIMYHCPALIAENGLVILFMDCDFEYIPPVWPEEPGRLFLLF